MGSLTHITIDFDTSHLIFPTLIGLILLVLAGIIVVRDRRAILASGAYWRQILGSMDRFRFFGTILLTVVYFSAMVPVGNIWPNSGMGFLLCSIPFVFLSGLVFTHDRGLRSLIPIAIVAIVAPTLVWYLFTDLFFLTLP